MYQIVVGSGHMNADVCCSIRNAVSERAEADFGLRLQPKGITWDRA